jgi:hypothetical protein
VIIVGTTGETFFVGSMEDTQSDFGFQPKRERERERKRKRERQREGKRNRVLTLPKIYLFRIIIKINNNLVENSKNQPITLLYTST